MGTSFGVSYGSFLWELLMGILMGTSYGNVLWELPRGTSYGNFLWELLMKTFYRNFLWELLMGGVHGARPLPRDLGEEAGRVPGSATFGYGYKAILKEFL